MEFQDCNLMDIYYLYDYPICIGLDSSGTKHINGDFANKNINKSRFHAIGCDSYLYQRYFEPHYISRGLKWNAGDTIHFIIDVIDDDFDDLEIGFKIGNNKIINYNYIVKNMKSCDDIWNIAITLPIEKDNVIQFIEFKSIHR